VPDDHIASAPHGQNPVNLPDHVDASRPDADRAGGSAEEHRAAAEAARSEAERFRRLAEEAREVRDQHRAELEAVREAQERLRGAGKRRG